MVTVILKRTTERLNLSQIITIFGIDGTFLFTFSIKVFVENVKSTKIGNDWNLECLYISGYRHIGLRNELNQPQNLSTLFVHVGVKDYVPDAFAGKYCFWE